MKTKPEHILLLSWLILSGLVGFALYISWHENLLLALFEVDRSRISFVIALLYILMTIHCAGRTFKISSEHTLSLQVQEIIKQEKDLSLKLDGEELYVNQTKPLPNCIMSEYIRDLFIGIKHLNKNDDATSDQSSLIEVYESRLKGPQEIGWFASDVLLKLGLLGTIIGFIFMLGSVANIADFDVSTMQEVLRHMSNGMGTALYTTLAGLICSILGAVQYHMIDRHADDILDMTRHLAHVHVLPKINQI